MVRPVGQVGLGRGIHREQSWERGYWEQWSVEPRVLVRILCAELELGLEWATCENVDDDKG